MNLYLYGLSNPLMFMDPLGLSGWDPCADTGFLFQALWQMVADYAAEFADSVEYIAENPETMYEGFYHLADQSSTAMADAATQTALNDARGDFTQVGAGDIYLNLLERQVGVNNVAEGVAGVDRAGNELITDPIERASLIATGISEMAGTAAGAAAPLTSSTSKAAGAVSRTADDISLPVANREFKPIMEGHHPDPKFMGGDPNQPTIDMPRGGHRQLHSDLNRHLRNYTDDLGNHMRPQRGNPGHRIQRNFSRGDRTKSLHDFYSQNYDRYEDAANAFFSQHPMD